MRGHEIGVPADPVTRALRSFSDPEKRGSGPARRCGGSMGDPPRPGQHRASTRVSHGALGPRCRAGTAHRFGGVSVIWPWDWRSMTLAYWLTKAGRIMHCRCGRIPGPAQPANPWPGRLSPVQPSGGSQAKAGKPASGREPKVCPISRRRMARGFWRRFSLLWRSGSTDSAAKANRPAKPGWMSR
jgi:hypothetical protein